MGLELIARSELSLSTTEVCPKVEAKNPVFSRKRQNRKCVRRGQTPCSRDTWRGWPSGNLLRPDPDPRADGKSRSPPCAIERD